MKAAVVTGPGKIEIMDVRKPVISSPEDIIIKVETASICNTTDYKIYSAADPLSVWPNEPRPYILGHECCGYIVDIGANVKDFHVGDRVVIWSIPGGAFAEYVKVSVNKAAIGKISGNISKYEAPLMEMTIGTARLMYDSNGNQVIRKNDKIVVYGLGPSGLVFINLARLMGAGRIVAVGRRKIRLEKALSMGADIVIDRDDNNALNKINEAVGKPNVVIDATGADILDEIFELSSPGMALLAYGVPPFNWQEQLSKLDDHGIRFYGGGLDEARAAVKYCIDWLEKGQLHLGSLITHKLPLDKVEYGLTLCHDFRDETLKVVLEIS